MDGRAATEGHLLIWLSHVDPSLSPNGDAKPRACHEASHDSLRGFRVSVFSVFLFETEESIMVDIIHRVGIKALPAEVYAAVATVEGVAGWWTKDATGISK